jgi:hypothetical protein
MPVRVADLAGRRQRGDSAYTRHMKAGGETDLILRPEQSSRPSLHLITTVTGGVGEIDKTYKTRGYEAPEHKDRIQCRDEASITHFTGRVEAVARLCTRPE